MAEPYIHTYVYTYLHKTIQCKRFHSKICINENVFLRKKCLTKSGKSGIIHTYVYTYLHKDAAYIKVYVCIYVREPDGYVFMYICIYV